MYVEIWHFKYNYVTELYAPYRCLCYFCKINSWTHMKSGNTKIRRKNIGLTRYLNLIKGWGDVSGLPPPAIYHENIKVGVELIIIILNKELTEERIVI